jgi:glyoxylase I family protein
MNNTNKIIAGCGFHHVAIRTANWETSRRFYTEGLGFVERVQWGEEPRRACLLDTGDGNYLEIFERDADSKPVEGEANILHWCLRVQSCDDATEVARAAGAQVTIEPTVPGPFTAKGLKTRIAFVKGPDGETLEFFESADL